MNFVHPQLLWLALPLLLLFAVAGLYAASRRKKMLTLLLGRSASDPAVVQVSSVKRNIRFALLTGAALLLVGAAARPYRSSRVILQQRFGRDILVLFDVSKSMWATDVAPSRLEHAKYLLRELVENSGSERFGFVAFAGRAFLACPLTSDKTTLLQYIDELGPESIPVGGTDLERPIKIALDAFEAAAGNRAVLLVTDGDELSGNSSAAVAELKERNIPLFVLGLGDPRIAAPVPDGHGGFQRTGGGELATSRLNEEKLKEFARMTGGMYLRSTVADPGISQLEARIGRLGRAEQESIDRMIPNDDFPFLLAGATLLLVLHLLLGERPSRWRAVLLLAALLPPAAPGATPAELYNQAREKQLAGEKDAAELYEQAIRAGARDAEIRARSLFNLGTASHREAEADLKKAVESVQSQQLDSALKMLDETLKRIGGAEELYRQSLAASGKLPNHLARLANDRRQAELLKRKIEELKEQQKKAQQQTGQAQQQNRQGTQQQNRQQRKQPEQPGQEGQQGQSKQQNQQQQAPPGQQGQQGQPGQEGQQGQPGQQEQSAPPDAARAIEQAREAAEQLKQQADELKQQRLSEQAERARQELEKAAQERRENRRSAAQQHLDAAARTLASAGENNEKERDGKPQSPQPSSGGEGESGENRENPGSGERSGDAPQPDNAGQSEKSEPAAETAKEHSASIAPAEEGAESADQLSEETAGQLLRMMQEEEKTLRDRVRPSYRERQADKDW